MNLQNEKLDITNIAIGNKATSKQPAQLVIQEDKKVATNKHSQEISIE